MNKTLHRNETREHLLATGEYLCLQRGFTGMGLSELLTQAKVPKGSFYHYFPSKEAFGVALLERYFDHYLRQIQQQLYQGEGSPRERLLHHFRYGETLFREQGHIVGCLAVKLSAEVCDLSEAMRAALQQGADRIMAAYARTLEQAQQQGEVSLRYPAPRFAELLYLLWLGASLQSKISREASALSLALHAIEQLLSEQS